MAQAARLNLRMQKEIKLLLNDPPPGVSLNLSEDENALSSLSSIHAKIEGPEGTVYSKGVFVLKIQIPERYPFQPPNVTFVTPIYHPNIDNGGRICLDILNLPPKGAWQPSLNISTILTSIGLLLSEPNPDDGLMAEISREYKYNRQIFDINARSWTEKYANPSAVGSSGWSSLDVKILAQNTQMEEKQNLESLSKPSTGGCNGSRKKMRLLGKKLSLKSEGSEDSISTCAQGMVTSHLPSMSRSTDPTKCLSDVSVKQNATSENMSVNADTVVISKKGYPVNKKKLVLPWQRLSVPSEDPSERCNASLEDKLPNHLPTSAFNTNDHVMQSSEDFLVESMTNSIGGSSDGLSKASEIIRTNVRSLSEKMSHKLAKPECKSNDQKENMAPNHLASLSGLSTLQKKTSDISRKSSIGDNNLAQGSYNTEHVLPNAQSIPNKEWGQGRKKLCLLSKRLSLKSELPEIDMTSDEGYKPPDCSQKDGKLIELPLSAPVPRSQVMGLGVISQRSVSQSYCSIKQNRTSTTNVMCATEDSADECEIIDQSIVDSQKNVNRSNCSIKQNTTPQENVVSDSEDSADECVRPSRSRLSLMKRRLAARIAPGVAAGALLVPLIGHDGRLIACSGKNLIAFDRNGSVAWIVHLGYNCNQDITPVSERDKIYLVVEGNKVMKVSPRNLHSSSTVPASQVFFSYNSTPGRSEEIIGLSTSGSYSSLFLTVMNRGLFAFSLRNAQMQWSAGPVLDRFGYRLGCKRNISGCYFNSAPAVDQCEGTLYISNTEGQLYSLYIHSRQYRWIQDLSSVDKVITIVPGNNGRVYVVLPRKSIVMGIDAFTGNISWQQSVGPLSNEKSLPVVDSNGWISIGSLDGTLYSISPDGDIRKFLQRTAPNSVIHASPVLDCSGFSVYISQTIREAKSSRAIGDYTYISATKPSSILFSLLAPATGTTYWTEKYPGELTNFLSSSDLNYFTLDETIFLIALSAERIGNTVQCYTRRQKIAWTCRNTKPKFALGDPGDHHSHVLLLFFFQLIVIVIQAVIVRFCCIFWRKIKLQNNDLQKFLEKRHSLHSKRRVLGKMISELEQKAVEDASSNETLEQLGEMVKAKEDVERKLYTSYSLGRDVLGLRPGSSILPLYNGKYKSHSFHGAQRESITVFNTLSDTSTSESRTSSSYSSGSGSCSRTSSEDMEVETNSKQVQEAGESSNSSLSRSDEFLTETMQQGRAPTKRM